MSRGHRLYELLTEYPISTVNTLIKAAHVNRIHDNIMSANITAVGTVHALEVGFGKGQAKALKKFIASLERAAKKLSRTGDEKQQDAEALLGAFGGFAGATKRGKRG